MTRRRLVMVGAALAITALGYVLLHHALYQALTPPLLDAMEPGQREVIEVFDIGSVQKRGRRRAPGSDQISADAGKNSLGLVLKNAVGLGVCLRDPVRRDLHIMLPALV